ncbi:hypothetical protein Tco_1500499 [Tanacetum coccineum]
MYHRTHGFTEHERGIYKSLEHRLFHEGRVIDPSYLGDQPNLLPAFAAIEFDCLLDINEKIFPMFVLQFYKSVRLIRSLNGTLSITFIVCVFTLEWAISSLPNGVDSNPDIYPPPHEDPLLICDALFYQRPPGKTCKVKRVNVTPDPFQMVLSELKINLKKWEIILSENAISLTGNKDHPNACLCYMIYYLTIGKPFNIAYYISKRMVSVTKSADMTLPYGMLLARLFEHVRVAHPYAFSDDLYLVDHVMIPLIEKRVFRIMPNGKRPRFPTLTPFESSKSPSPFLHQEEEYNPVNNYTLDPIPYINQLQPIKGGESLKFKQTKGMFNCFGHFLSNPGKNK